MPRLRAARSPPGPPGRPPDKQADDIVVLDVHELIVITDFFVICSASLEPSGEDRDREHRGLDPGRWARSPIRREGEDEAGWWLLDYVDVVVHVFGTRNARTTTWNVSGATRHARAGRGSDAASSG